MKQITQAGGNLFQIAARYLGDATQWLRIAQLNNISDPMLSGIVTLTIPDVDPNATDIFSVPYLQYRLYASIPEISLAAGLITPANSVASIDFTPDFY